MEIERGDARARRRRADALEAALGDVRATVRDWRAMRAAMPADTRCAGGGAPNCCAGSKAAMTQLKP